MLRILVHLTNITRLFQEFVLGAIAAMVRFPLSRKIVSLRGRTFLVKPWSELRSLDRPAERLVTCFRLMTLDYPPRTSIKTSSLQSGSNKATKAKWVKIRS
jgi:hypothetical protein